MRGHLKVKLVAKGDDAWEKTSIHSTVTTGRLRHVPGTIDAFEWEEEYQEFVFDKDVVLSTDPGEGFATWTLKY